MIVTFYGNALKYTNNEKTYEADSVSNLLSLIDVLSEHYGKAFKDFLLGDETCLILKNGKAIQSTGGLDTVLKHSDEVDILPFVSAG